MMSGAQQMLRVDWETTRPRRRARAQIVSTLAGAHREGRP
jgi:bifunctional ADP-heptose synthase (sugar kinase/adenylyltransferase)